VIYSLFIDDMRLPDESRPAARERLDKFLSAPLDDQVKKQEAQQIKREEWGLTPDAIAADKRDSHFWSQHTYGMR
jgi:hypothetical protein